MKTKLLFLKPQSNTFFTFLVFCFCFNYGWSQNLLLNSSMDEFTITTNDNADAWDMSPSTTVVTDDDVANGTTTNSPYKALWNNSDLDSWLNTNCGDSNEAPGSSSDGNFDYSAGPTMGVPTRGLKINEACRRLYQYVAVTPNVSYTLFMQSRSELADHPTEVYILNTEIADEVNFSSTSSTVDDYFEITNDFSSSKSNATTDNFTQSSFEFTPSGNFIVVYLKSPNTIGSSDEVFYDNIELYETSSLSADDLASSSFNVYPNPAKDFIAIKSNTNQITLIKVYDVLGKNVITQNKLINNRLDISKLNKGLYFIKIDADGNSLTKKIIKH